MTRAPQGGPKPQPPTGLGPLVLGCLLGWALGCAPGSPVLCEAGLPDGGCSYHVEVHCGDAALCSAGSTQVLDAGTCIRDTAADVIGCS
jgi:hypothetical protein